MMAGGPYDPGLIPWDEYRHALYAHRFGWTPEQVDQMPLTDDAWLLPICNAIDAEVDKRNKKDAEKANKKGGQGR
jgi:hypothetical protein